MTVSYLGPKPKGLVEMPKQVIAHITDNELLKSLPKNGDKHEFACLPFYIMSKSIRKKLEGNPHVRIFFKPRTYVQLLQGIDYLIEGRVNVINLSLGMKSKTGFDEHEPIHIATKFATDQRISVVAAAGNYGPRENTLQRIAIAPWVISVGATDGDRKVIQSSSRGSPGGLTPTLVSIGHSKYLRTIKAPDELGERFAPSTSFACSQVSRIFSFNLMMFRTLVIYFDAWIKESIGRESPPIPFHVLGFADTGIGENAESLVHPKIRDYINQSRFSFTVKHLDILRSINQIMSFYIESGEPINASVTPQKILDITTSMCERMDGYEQFEVGSGFICHEIALQFWLSLTPSKLLRMLLPVDRHSKIQRFLEADNRIFNEEHVKLIFDFATQSPFRMAKVLA